MKKWLVTAGVLMLMGCLIFTMSGCASGWSFGGKHVEKSVEVTDAFSDIDITSDTADITFSSSTDGSCKVVYYNNKKISYSVSVENGVLKIKPEGRRNWLGKFFDFGKSSLTIYLPGSEYGSLSIKEDTGDIEITDYKFENVDIKLSTGDVDIKNITTGDFSLKLSTGDVSINGITCSNFVTTGDTGDISVNNLTANGNATIERSTGDVNVNTATVSGNLYSKTSTGNNNVCLANCGGDIEVKVSTGKSLLSDITCANLTTTGDTGNLSMSNVIASGKFSIERSTGDVHFDRCDAAEIYVTTDTGDVSGTLLSEKVFVINTDVGKVQVPESYSGGKCKITTDTGDVKISIGQ